MSITSPLTLLLAAALASPTLYQAFVGDVEVGDAAIRFLICVPVAAIMLALLGSLTRDYGRNQPRRRANDPKTNRPAADGAVEADQP